MQARQVACVIGGSGFIGRYVVKRLAAQGFIVRVAVRDPEAAMCLKPMGGVGQVVPLCTAITNEAALTRAISGAAVVVNLVGILAEARSGDFARVQADGAGLAAWIAARCGVARFIQVSAIGADAASPSLYAQSKAAGEAQVTQAFPGATILRPSIVFGPEDQFFNRFAAMAVISPVLPVICGETRFQPVYVGDVADAVMAALANPTTAGKTYELGGPEVLTFRAIMRLILQITGRARILLTLPSGIAALLARIPFSGLTADQLKLLAMDNVANPALPGLAALGVRPTAIGLVVPGYLARYRRGGLRVDYAKRPKRA